MGTTVSPASITDRVLGQVERAPASAATPVGRSLTRGHGRRELAAVALPSVKRSA
jgi:hypothetical protein